MLNLIMYGSTVILYARLMFIFATCCLKIIASPQAPENMTLALAASTSVNASAQTTANALVKVVVIPKTQERILQIQQVLDTTITNGHAIKVESAHIIDYIGVLFWSVNAEEAEVQQLREKLRNDVNGMYTSRRKGHVVADTESR